jgi:hypothetical protein
VSGWPPERYSVAGLIEPTRNINLLEIEK